MEATVALVAFVASVGMFAELEAAFAAGLVQMVHGQRGCEAEVGIAVVGQQNPNSDFEKTFGAAMEMLAQEEATASVVAFGTIEFAMNSNHRGVWTLCPARNFAVQNAPLRPNGCQKMIEQNPTSVI